MKVRRKMFFAWNIGKEKKWLEEQARKGLILKDISLGRYIFEESEPKDLVYQFDFQILNKKKEEEYLQIYSDWTLVKRFGSWYYFCKERENNKKDDIFNDLESKRNLFIRLAGILLVVGLPLYYNLIIFLPKRTDAELSFPSFYFFMRIFTIILVSLHLLAILKLLFVIRSYKAPLSE